MKIYEHVKLYENQVKIDEHLAQINKISRITPQYLFFVGPGAKSHAPDSILAVPMRAIQIFDAFFHPRSHLKFNCYVKHKNPY